MVYLYDLDLLSTVSLALCIESLLAIVLGGLVILLLMLSSRRGHPENDAETADPIKEKEAAVKEAKRELAEAKREQKQARGEDPWTMKMSIPLFICLLAITVLCVVGICLYDSALGTEVEKAYEEGHRNGFAEGESKEYIIAKPKMDALGEFYHEHAVVCDTDKYYYHHFECSNFEGESFYIFNSEYAKSLGYLPCEECIE